MLCTLIFVRDQIKSQPSNSQQLSHNISDVHGQKDQGQAAIKSTTLRLIFQSTGQRSEYTMPIMPSIFL